MTNKMPVVGKRYKTNTYKNILVTDVIYKEIWYKYVLGNGDYSIKYAILTDEFWDYCKEPPEDNKKGIVAIFPDFAEEPNQPTEALKAEMAKEKKEVSEVDRALEELKQIHNSLPAQYSLYGKAVQNLINALEVEKSLCLKNEGKLDTKEFDSRLLGAKNY